MRNNRFHFKFTTGWNMCKYLLFVMVFSKSFRQLGKGIRQYLLPFNPPYPQHILGQQSLSLLQFCRGKSEGSSNPGHDLLVSWKIFAKKTYNNNMYINIKLNILNKYLLIYSINWNKKPNGNNSYVVKDRHSNFSINKKSNIVVNDYW